MDDVRNSFVAVAKSRLRSLRDLKRRRGHLHGAGVAKPASEPQVRAFGDNIQAALQEAHMRLLCLAACLVIAAISAGQSHEPVQPHGRIIGSVVNDSNEPVGNAVLCTSVVRTNSANTSCGSQTADTQGHFDIIVPLETNRVFAQNPQAGYQRPNNPMQDGVHVKLSELEPVAHVKIKVGERPAELILTVTDRATGKPVDSFIVRWIRIDDGPIVATDSRKSRVLVPPDVELLLTVQAAGYEHWFYSDVSAPSRPTLRLASGEQKAISVELDPR